ELNIMNLGPGRNVAQRQRVSGADRRIGPGLDGVPHFQAGRRQDVPLLAIDVVQKSDSRGAIRIVLDSRNFRRNTVLIPLEVDDPVETPLAAAPVPRRDAAAIVASSVLFERLDQALFRLFLCDLLEGTDAHRAPPRGGWFIDTNRHSGVLPSSPWCS